MKIVILDAYVENPGDLSWDALGALGELTVYDRVPEHDPAEIARYIGDAEIEEFDGEELPADFVCPLCGKDASYFELVEE